MSDQLLSLFNKELSYIRHQAASFAKAYPKLAGHLNITPNKIENPDISRLIEAVALMNSKIRLELEGQFPRLAESVLNMLAPNFNAPIPPMAMIQLQPLPNLSKTLFLEKGSVIESRPVNGEPCYFQLGFDTEVLPLTVSRSQFTPHNQQTPRVGSYEEAQCVLTLHLVTTTHNVKLETLNLKRVRLHLKGQINLVYRLYEALLTDCLQLVVTDTRQSSTVILRKDHLLAVGFDDDSILLPRDSRTPIAYTLLSEFLTFPEKFLFIDIILPDDVAWNNFDQTILLHFYFKTAHPAFEQYTNRDNFALNAAPMINLFEQRLEPITLMHHTLDYAIDPAPENRLHKEIYQLTEVAKIDGSGNAEVVSPLYTQKFKHLDAENTCFYQMMRTQGEPVEGQIDHGTDITLSLVNTQLDLTESKAHVLSISALCTNRDLVNQLPFGGAEPRLKLSEGSRSVNIQCLTKPTKALRLGSHQNNLWSVVALLQMNFTHLLEKHDIEQLKSLLMLFSHPDNVMLDSLLRALISIESKQIIARNPNCCVGITSFCQGVEIILELDEERFITQSAYLFSSVLDQLFALAVSINAFTQLTIKNKGKRKTLYQWQSRLGSKALV